MRAPFRLKVPPKEGHPPDRCAASRCLEASDVIDNCRSTWPFPVPLCERHWRALCDWQERAVDKTTDAAAG